MSDHPSNLAAIVAALQTEVATLRAEVVAAKAVHRRSRLRGLTPLLTLLCIISLSLTTIPATRAQTPEGAADAEKGQLAEPHHGTPRETSTGASPNTTGQPLVVGQSNSASAVGDKTRLFNQSSTQLMPQTFQVDNYSTGGGSIANSLQAGRSIAIVGSTSGNEINGTRHVGVMGLSDKNEGVYGSSSGIVGIGVRGEASNALVAGYGVVGDAFASEGTGVAGNGGKYGGTFDGARAAIRLDPATTAGPPTTGVHSMGELVVSSDGHLWFCRADGTPGEWVRLDLAATFLPLIQK